MRTVADSKVFEEGPVEVVLCEPCMRQFTAALTRQAHEAAHSREMARIHRNTNFWMGVTAALLILCGFVVGLFIGSRIA